MLVLVAVPACDAVCVLTQQRAGRVRDADAVYRTDVFPGLGWMMTLEIWREIGDRWPQSYWDEWMRLPEVRTPG